MAVFSSNIQVVPSGVLDRIRKSSAYSKYLTSVLNNCSPELSDWFMQ